MESVQAVPAKLINPDDSPGGDVSLDSLPDAGGRMNFPPDPKSYESQMQQQFGNVGYHRRVDGGGLSWHQYWLWYLYNPKRIIVTGEHEGDWEFVQVAYAGDTPVCVTCSQHRSGGGRMWWDVKRKDDRPLIYVALGSHANYFSPVDGIPEVGDDGDGQGAVLDSIEWRDFGPWATWTGRWGNSRGEGKSPESPGQQGDRWSAPHRYHSKARIEL